MSRQIGYGSDLSEDDLVYLRNHNDPRGFIEAQADEVEADGAEDLETTDETEEQPKAAPKAKAKA